MTTRIVWGRITSRPTEEALFVTKRPSPYEALINELTLRLEKTLASEMLDIPLADRKEANAVRAVLKKHFDKRLGAGAVRFGLDPLNEVGGVSLLVARGPNYPKTKTPQTRVSRGRDEFTLEDEDLEEVLGNGHRGR